MHGLQSVYSLVCADIAITISTWRDAVVCGLEKSCFSSCKIIVETALGCDLSLLFSLAIILTKRTRLKNIECSGVSSSYGFISEQKLSGKSACCVHFQQGIMEEEDDK